MVFLLDFPYWNIDFIETFYSVPIICSFYMFFTTLINNDSIMNKTYRINATSAHTIHFTLFTYYMPRYFPCIVCAIRS